MFFALRCFALVLCARAFQQRQACFHRRGTLLRADDESRIDVQAEWLKFKASQPSESNSSSVPPVAFARRKEVVGGMDVAERPQFRSDVSDEEQRERDFLSGVVSPRNFAIFGAFVAALFVFQLIIFLTPGESPRYAPGFDGTSESIADLLGAVLPNEDSILTEDLVNNEDTPLGSGPVV